jgi:hypothetical protein
MNSETVILKLMANDLEATSLKRTGLELRDRSTYLGLSDLAKALS